MHEDFCYVPGNVYELSKAAGVRTLLDFAVHVISFPTYYIKSLDWTMEDLKKAKIKFYAATGIEELISEPKPKQRAYGAINPIELMKKDVDKARPSDF